LYVIGILYVAISCSTVPCVTSAVHSETHVLIKNIWPQQQYFITRSPTKTSIHWVDFTAPGAICKRSFTQLSIQFVQLVVALHASPRTLH